MHRKQSKREQAIHHGMTRHLASRHGQAAQPVCQCSDCDCGQHESHHCLYQHSCPVLRREAYSHPSCWTQPVAKGNPRRRSVPPHRHALDVHSKVGHGKLVCLLLERAAPNEEVRELASLPFAADERGKHASLLDHSTPARCDAGDFDRVVHVALARHKAETHLPQRSADLPSEAYELVERHQS